MIKKATNHGTVTGKIFETNDENGNVVKGISLGIYGNMSVVTLESRDEGLCILINDEMVKKHEVKIFHTDRNFNIKRDENETIIRLNSEFLDAIDELTIKPGSFNVVVENTKTGKSLTTQGDIHVGDTWKDFLEWLINDMKEMGIGELKDLSISYIEYVGMDNGKYSQ